MQNNWNEVQNIVGYLDIGGYSNGVARTDERFVRSFMQMNGADDRI